MTLTSASQTARRWWDVSPRLGGALGLIALLLIGLALRVVLLQRGGWLLEGDDSLSTLMALAILDGDRPIMLKGQTYAAAWEPYGMAASYALFGVSRVAARLPVLVFSLMLIGVTWLLAREAAGDLAGWLAAALATIPPIYILVLSLKPFAPYTEVSVFGSLGLACALRLAFRSVRRPAIWAVGCGLAGGLAFWMHPLAIYYLLTIALILIFRLRGERLVETGAVTLVGFAIGAMPVWLYNFQTGGATVRFVLAGTGSQTADRLAVLSAFWNSDLPRALGLWQPWGDSPRALSILVGTATAGAVAWALLWQRRRRAGLRALDGVLILLAAIPLVFVFSGFGGPALNPWGFDATGRYTLPIWGAVAVLLGAFGSAVWHWRRLAAASFVSIVLAVNLYGWGAADAVQAFQSPYWTRLPVENGELLRTLGRKGIGHVWMNHWAGLPAMFDARAGGQKLIAYDWYDLQAGGIDRFPEYLPLMERAERTAFVLVTDEPEPELERRLRELGVSYEIDRILPYVVVTPASRQVHPSEVTSALDYRY